MFDLLFDHIRTTDEAAVFLNEIDILRNSLYQSKPQAFEEVLHTKVRASVAAVLQELFATESKEPLLQQLKQLIEAAPIARLTIAIEPSDSFLTTITRLCRRSAPNALVSLTVDHRIVGGAIIEIGGKYWDQSVRKKLQATLDERIRRIGL